MDLTLVIQALRERCPEFSGRVGGAAQFGNLKEISNLPVPCAYVIPLDDAAESPASVNDLRQICTDSFAVVVCVGNTQNERGQTAIASIQTLRAALWSALIGWVISPAYSPIFYDGGAVLELNRAQLWYQFEFAAKRQIFAEDGWRDRNIVGLPNFDGCHFSADFIDPRDPNLAVTPSGGDGRIEVAFSAETNPT